MKLNIVRLGMGVSALCLLFMCLCPVSSVVLALETPVDTLGDNSSVVISANYKPVDGFIETWSTSASECMKCLEESAWKSNVPTFDQCVQKSVCTATKVCLDSSTESMIFFSLLSHLCLCASSAHLESQLIIFLIYPSWCIKSLSRSRSHLYPSSLSLGLSLPLYP
jgi:hypothetical protein